MNATAAAIPSALLLARVLLSVAVVYAGISAVRVSLFGDQLDLPLPELGKRNRQADSMRLSASR